MKSVGQKARMANSETITPALPAFRVGFDTAETTRSFGAAVMSLRYPLHVDLRLLEVLNLYFCGEPARLPPDLSS